MIWLLASCLSDDGGFGTGGQSSAPVGGGGVGTDPIDTADPDADTDGDGFSDADERAAGTDPEACWSVPQGWPQCAHEAGAGEGFAPGERAPNWTLIDQNGDELSFHQLAGMVVVVDVSAGWCGPCNQAAGVAEAWYQARRDDGVMMVHLMIEDTRSQPADTAFCAEWAEEYGLTFPVGTEDEGVYDALFDEGLIQGVPAYLVYDRDLRLQAAWAGYSPELLDDAVDQLD